MAHMVMCRLCKKRFDLDSEEAMVVGIRSYYHKKCYEEWKQNNSTKGNMSNDFWYEALIDYLYRDVKLGNMDFSKIGSQWRNFTKPDKGFTPKGIYFAIKYFYEIKHGDAEKASGGIGIVPSIYNQSAQYWIERENQKAGTIDAIVQQIHERAARPVERIKRVEKPKNQPKWNLDDI